MGQRRVDCPLAFGGDAEGRLFSRRNGCAKRNRLAKIDRVPSGCDSFAIESRRTSPTYGEELPRKTIGRLRSGRGPSAASRSVGNRAAAVLLRSGWPTENDCQIVSLRRTSRYPQSARRQAGPQSIAAHTAKGRLMTYTRAKTWRSLFAANGRKPGNGSAGGETHARRQGWD